jgi:hypothetical protein
LAGKSKEGFSGEGGIVAYVLNTSDLKHDSKLTVGVMYALVINGFGIRFLFTAATAIMRHAGCRFVRGQWYTRTQGLTTSNWQNASRVQHAIAVLPRGHVTRRAS